MGEWVGREMSIAIGSGAVSGGVVVAAVGGSFAGILLGAFIGSVLGAVVGGVSVAAGHLAIRAAAFWPAPSERCWRARFASCSAAAIFLLMSMCSMWVLSTFAGEASLMMPGVAVGFAAATFVCTLVLAPRSASKSDTARALWIPR